MNYLRRLSFSPIYQAVMSDWMSISQLLMMRAPRKKYIELGFDDDTAEYLSGENSRIDVIISALDSTHKGKVEKYNEMSEVKTIFSDVSLMRTFSKEIQDKGKEFESVLLALALQCPARILYAYRNDWTENQKNLSRIRNIYAKPIQDYKKEMHINKAKMYKDFTFDPSLFESVKRRGTIGRRRKTTFSELANIDKSLKEAEDLGLLDLEKYIYVAKNACVYIADVEERELSGFV